MVAPMHGGTREERLSPPLLGITTSFRFRLIMFLASEQVAF